MKKRKKSETPKERPSRTDDPTLPDSDSDKSGSDDDADSTETGGKESGSHKFSKPKREVDPDRTGIDTNADKTKK
ncbi:MAG: hypothetical protein PSX36_14700 [bacterium]|nr:hypothetical protein [bacterium]